MVIFLTRGTSGIDIDLRRVDINQCQAGKDATGTLNIFGGTDKCKKDTTTVSGNNAAAAAETRAH